MTKNMAEWICIIVAGVATGLMTWSIEGVAAGAIMMIAALMFVDYVGQDEK